jgi:hypothetical protein
MLLAGDRLRNFVSGPVIPQFLRQIELPAGSFTTDTGLPFTPRMTPGLPVSFMQVYHYFVSS